MAHLEHPNTHMNGTTPKWRPDWRTSFRPDWRAMLANAVDGDGEDPGYQALKLDGEQGYVYWIADAHLGDAKAPPAVFLDMLERLTDARVVVFLGDLFQVWLAYPHFWDNATREVLAGFARLREKGVKLVFVRGNREYFLPAGAARVSRRGLPFDAVVLEAGVLRWGKRRYGMTHGDLLNRNDTGYLKWRRFSRSAGFEFFFRVLPGFAARWLANRLEVLLSKSNREIKIQYPLEELEAFSALALPGMDGYFIGHFHREETIAISGQKGVLRIVPDWLSQRRVYRLDAKGNIEVLSFS